MLKNSKLRLGAVAAFAVAALAFGVTAPAFADPTPGNRDLNGVGSDTTQDVMNGLASAIPAIGSYDAIGPNPITTRTGGFSFARPNGSSAGVQALSRAAQDLGVNGLAKQNDPLLPGFNPSLALEIDFARSSSAPASNLGGNDLTFIPFGRDAVTFAVNGTTEFPRNIPVGSAAQDATVPAPFTVRNIYRTCPGPVVVDPVTGLNEATGMAYTNTRTFATVRITPLLPQSGSGTRNFFLNSIGFTGSNPTGFGVCVKSAVALNSATPAVQTLVQENDGTVIRRVGDIVPFSVGQFIAQGYNGTQPTAVIERRGFAQLGSISGQRPTRFGATGLVEVNGTGPSAIVSNRLVYNVVETAKITVGNAKFDQQLVDTFVGSSSAVCLQASLISLYGFSPIANCGDVIETQAWRP